jgi:CarD family transcriptional regulator
VTTFDVGDAVVHPVRGAGVVVGFRELKHNGTIRLYYTIELMGLPDSSLMIPVKSANENCDLRPPIPESKLRRVWEVLSIDPEALPADHKVRYKLLEEKLRSGDILQVAAAVRDMTWRREQENGLTSRGQRIYQRAMMLLAGEIAATQRIDLADAEAKIGALFRENLLANAPT